MKYVALLRAINVGGNRRVPMADLKALLSALGLTEVKTYINSGNVWFESTHAEEELAPLIEDALEKKFGFTVPTIIRTIDELNTLIDADPFAKEPLEAFGFEAYKTVSFLDMAPDPTEWKALAGATHEREKIELIGRDIVSFIYRAPGESTPFAINLAEKRLKGVRATNRNWRTLLTLARS